MGNRLHEEQMTIPQVGIYLKHFSWDAGRRLANFRCPICNDSKKNASKARAYIYLNSTTRSHYDMICHNCSASMSYMNFLKSYFSNIHTQLKIAIALNEDQVYLDDVPKKEATLKELEVPSVFLLANNHPAKVYCESRMIEKKAMFRIKYTEDFNAYLRNYITDESYLARMPKQPRLLFELRDSNKEIFGVQARVIGDDDKNRFITVKFKDRDKIYGLDALNTKLPIIVTEGVIDSLFVKNSIALVGGDVPSNLDKLLGVSKKSIYVALDNEPRKSETIHRMMKAIANGYNVYFWNVSSKYKDINKMVQNGIDISVIYNDILAKSLNGILADLELSVWKKV